MKRLNSRIASALERLKAIVAGQRFVMASLCIVAIVTNRPPPLPVRTLDPLPAFIASIDTMKESRDTATRPLTITAIRQSVQLAAKLGVNYITVDTHWDYPQYMKKWIDAIRATGRRVWFRGHPRHWEDGAASQAMTPQAYKEIERRFILDHPTFFKSGDIFDPCPEPENGRYWQTAYGDGWTAKAPNEATKAFNAFIRDTTDIADSAFQEIGISGVITTIRSTNAYFPLHPEVLEAATVARLGVITIDSYPEGTTLDPRIAAQARVDELDAIKQLWNVPIVLGEMGYSNKRAVVDETQRRVLKAEFDALAKLPYLRGVNYWVGAGTDQSGGYTHIFQGSPGRWRWRSAAYELAAFYRAMLRNSGSTPNEQTG